jgi:hypothetical protein
MKDNGVFTQEQEDLTEEINLRLFEKQRHDLIKLKMSEFLKGLK